MFVRIRVLLSIILMLSGMHGLVAASGAVFTPPASPHADYNFNPGWKFIREDIPKAQAIAFADSKWSDVSTPHT